MYSRKALGTVALSAFATAAVSFAVVDVSTSVSRGCASVADICAHEAVPIVAVTSAALGVLCLAVGVVPTILWIIASVHAARSHGEEFDEDTAEAHRRALRGDDPLLAESVPVTAVGSDAAGGER